jgi:hypothetical protein
LKDKKKGLIIRRMSVSLFSNRFGQVSVKIKAAKGTYITAAKWAEGAYDAGYFEKSGKNMNREKGRIVYDGKGCASITSGKYSFQANGKGKVTYTAFLKDKYGNIDVRVIRVKRAVPISITIAALFSLLLAAGIAGILIIPKAGSAPVIPTVSEPSIVSVANASASSISAGTQSKDMVKDSLALYVSFSDGSAGSSGTWQLSNTSSNNVIMQAKIYINGALAATSPAIKPGQNIKSITLQKAINPGSYSATAYINYFNLKTQDYISSAGYQINVTVK